MMENIRHMKTNAMQHLMPPNPFKDDGSGSKITYTVTVTTGAMKFAGTDSNVFIALTGASGEKSSLAKLDNSFHDDFERGSVDKFKVKLEDIGQPAILTIKHDEAGMFADWYAVAIIIQKAGDPTDYTFPINMWLTGTTDVAIGTAKLAHLEENPVLVSFRKHEIANKRRNVKWRSQERADAKGLPGFIMAECVEDLPRNLRLEEGMSKDFEEAKKVGKHNILEKFHEVFDGKLWDFSEFRNLFSHPKMQKVPEFQQSWERDEEFGRQMLNGCNPNILKRCDELPKKFPVTHGLVGSQLTRGLKLDQEIKNGNIYIIDLDILEGMPCGKNSLNQAPFFSCAPMCLLYVNSKKNLVPIAIQLWQQPGPSNPIWTPDDSDCDWLLSKIYFRNAESNVQVIVEKLFRSHFILEPFTLGIHRCLSTNHPVHKLLAPHLRYVCAGNVAIRSSLINSGGIVDKLLSYGGGTQHHLLRAAFKSFRFEQMNVRKLLEANGTSDKSKLPGYLYREDAFLLWDCILTFVRNILKVYYETNEDVKLDVELQNCVQEIRNEGFLWEDGNAKGLPEYIDTIDQLTEFLSCVVFTASCRHAAVTNGLFDIFINVPNAPLSMSIPPPTEKGKSSHDTVLQALPGKHLTCMQMSVCHIFSKQVEEQVYLADYPSNLFCEDLAQRAVVQFKDELQEMSAMIRSRNEGSMIPYDYLLPEKIPVAMML